MTKLNRDHLERLNILYELDAANRRRLITYMKPTATMEIRMGGMTVKIEGGDEDIRKIVVAHLAKIEADVKAEIESMGFEITNYVPSEAAIDA